MSEPESTIRADRIDTNDLLVLLLAGWEGLRRLFGWTNLRWLLFSVYAVHLGTFGLTELATGRIRAGLFRLLAPWAAAWLLLSVHPGNGLLRLLIWLGVALVAFAWAKRALVTALSIPLGTVEVTPAWRDGERDAHGAPVEVVITHTFEGPSVFAIYAALALYYQYLALHWAELPLLPTVVEWVRELFAMLPVLGTPAG